MLFYSFLAPLALPVVIAAVAIPVKRQGTSGFVVRPAGGYSSYQDTWFLFEYQPVLWQDTEGAAATSFVDLDFYNNDNGQTSPVARGLTSCYEASSAAFGIITGTFNFDDSPICGDLQLIVTEHQVSGPVFRSAAPNVSLICDGSTWSTVVGSSGGALISPSNGETLSLSSSFQV